MVLKIDHCGTPDLIVAGLIVPLLISLLCVDPGCIKQGFDIMRQSACLVLTQSRFIAMVSSLIARRWVRPQTLYMTALT